jgi:hypothetical protein
MGGQIMKKLVMGVLVVVLLVLATSVASAEEPPGVDVAIRVSEFGCGTSINGSLYLSTKFFTQYSNGATGHSTFKCKLELVQGPPEDFFMEFSSGNCDTTISIEGKKGMWTTQCFGDWFP